MSIIAVKVTPEKIEIASDSIVVRGNTQDKSSNTFSKLIKINDLIIGSSGFAQESSLLSIFCATRRPEQATESAVLNFFSEFVDWKRNKIDDATIVNDYIFVVDKRAFYIESFFVEEIINFSAIGAGSDYALAALHLGHSVSKAVEVACELSVYCEKPIKLYEVFKN